MYLGPNCVHERMSAVAAFLQKVQFHAIVTSLEAPRKQQNNYRQ